MMMPFHYQTLKWLVFNESDVYHIQTLDDYCTCSSLSGLLLLSFLSLGSPSNSLRQVKTRRRKGWWPKDIRVVSWGLRSNIMHIIFCMSNTVGIRITVLSGIQTAWYNSSTQFYLTFILDIQQVEFFTCVNHIFYSKQMSSQTLLI